MSVDTKSGLRIKPIYEQLISVALSDDNQNIRFPNRDAKFLRAGFELSQLDGFGWEAMHRQQEMAQADQYKQALIKQIAKNTGIDASSLRTEVDHQNRQMSVKSMLSGSSHITAEYYDMAAADVEEAERQHTIDTIEREKDKKEAYTGLVQEEHIHLTESPIMSAVREQASKLRARVAEQFAPSASSSGAGETTSATLGRPRTKPRPDFGTEDTSNPRGRPKGKAKAKD